MALLNSVAMYARFVVGLPLFLRRRLTLEQAFQTISTRIASREENFLRLVDRGIYESCSSPYRFLLAEAGCERGDLRKLVAEEGLDAALGKLYDSGVRVSFDEFKGRAAIMRGGRAFEPRSNAFDNPFVRGHYEAGSTGSSGAPTRVMLDLDHIHATAWYHLLVHEAHGVRGAPILLWAPGLPSGNGVSNLIRSILIDNPVREWYSPLAPSEYSPALRFKAATSYVAATTGFYGGRQVRPKHVPFGTPVAVAIRAAEFVASDGRCLVRTPVSMALRVSLAANAAGIDLTHVTFMGGGEPATVAKVRGIRSSGARYISSYVFSEAGPVGIGCANPFDTTDVHFFEDLLAIVERPQNVPGTDRHVNGLSFTTLLPTAPKLMLNVDSDDFGIVEKRSCGCLLESAGFGRHIRQIGSARKLTGESITLVGSDMVEIIQELLPTRFGGSALDYQLVEEEDESGITRLTLIVSPEVVLESEEAVLAELLVALGRVSAGADSSRAIIRGAASLRLRRERPLVVGRGKSPPFRTAAAK